MPDKPPRRRFIAGAVCPRCALMDKIVVDLDTDQRVCVSCGFSESRPGLPAAGALTRSAGHAPELPTRVSRAAARRVETPAQPVKLIDSAGKGKPHKNLGD
ncbi:MAG: YheV family putative metal-binding protein [Halioglobus sp.]